MSALSIQPTYPIFTDIDGQPLDAGYIFIGTANLNPISSPINVYWDAALTQPAAQPIRTISGYPSNAGTPGRLYVNSEYSIQVQNKNGTLVYSAPTPTEQLSSNLVTFIQAGTGAVTRTVQNRLRETISVKDFGAVGDGVVDDTTAIQNAEAAAFAAGAVLLFPPGTYLQNGVRIFRCSISGYGATIKNTIGSEQNVNAAASIRVSGSDLYVEGITTDGNSYLAGFNLVENSRRITFRDCIAKNSLTAGFNAYYCNDCSYINCLASGVKYAALGLIAADGFYIGACNDMSYINCTAENFERIGFVSEGESTNDSYRTRYVSCVARNGNNCDRSPSEFNTGFWSENTNGTVIDDCSVYDIAGNAGQTSGRVGGIVLNAIGDSIDHLAVLSNTNIGDSTGTLPFGVSVSGGSDEAQCVIKNVHITNCAVGISSLGSIDSLSIEDVTVFDPVYQGNTGSFVLDQQGSAIKNIFIRNLKDVNATYTNVAGATVNFFSGGSNTNVVIDGLEGSIVLRDSAKNLSVSNSNIVVRSNVYNTIGAAANATITNTNFYAASGTVNGNLTNSSGGTGTYLYSNCTFNNVVFTSFALKEVCISNCVFNDSKINWEATLNDSKMKMNGCLCRSTTGAELWLGNFYNITGDSVIIQNSSFYSSATDAILERNHTPDVLILQGNNYSTTNLTNMTPTNSANNVSTP